MKKDDRFFLPVSFREDGNVDVELVAVQLVELLGIEVRYLPIYPEFSTQVSFSRDEFIDFVPTFIWAKILKQLKAEGRPTASVEMAMARYD